MSQKETVVYVRVSSAQQDTKSQERDLKRYVFSLDEGQTVSWHSDSFTGKTMNRPGWEEVEKKIRQGKVISLVVWRLDRLGRTASGLHQLFGLLREKKVNLVSISDGVNLNTSTGRMLAGILASLAEWETEVRGERVRAGIDKARESGKRWGGSVKGSRGRTNDKATIDVVVRSKREGKKIVEIARATGLSRWSVSRILEKEEDSSSGEKETVAVDSKVGS
jgi:DNA invertase Pin-like site-specific DNA recombinase